MLSQLRKAVQTRFDGWYNALTGLGVATGKANFAFAPMDGEVLTLADLDTLYNFDGIAAKIVDAVPKHAMRQGFTIAAPDTTQQDALHKTLRALNLSEMVQRAWTWGRLYGGGALYLGIEDGRAPEEPVDTDSLVALRWVTDVDRRDLQPLTWNHDVNSPAFGKPLTYRLARSGGTATEVITVHASRIVRFEGVTPTRFRRRQQQGWGDSILQRVYLELQQARGAFAASGELVQAASQGVLKLRGLMDMMASDSDDLVKKRLQLMDMSRSIARSLLLDAEGEDYTRVESSALTGVADVLDRKINLLSAVSGIPVTILMGQAPAGLNATGDTDLRNWYDEVQSEREKILTPRIEHIVRLIVRSKEGPTAGVEPEGWKLKWSPLWQSTPSEQAQLQSQVAQTDVAYIQAGVVTPEEVALSRFRPDGWSAETTIDYALRDATNEAHKAAE